MEIIAIANHKGGCGKTTTSINLAYALSAQQRKVLLIDLDPQGHATLGLNINPDKLDKTIFDLLKPESTEKVKDVIIPVCDNLDILPSNMNVSYLEQLLSGKAQRELKLKNVLKKIKTYDFMIIDTAPSLGLLTINALLAANKVIIPIEPGNFALHGVEKLEQTIEMLKNKSQHKLEVRYLCTLFNPDSKFSQDFKNILTSYFGHSLFKTKITLSDVYKNASVIGTPVMKYEPDSTESNEYSNIANEVIAWTKNISPVFISNLPKNASTVIAFTKKSAEAQENNYIELLQKADESHQYKYVIDTNGNISTVKFKSYGIFEKTLN